MATTGACSALPKSTTFCSKGLFSKPLSSTLAKYITGFTVIKQSGFNRLNSSLSKPSVRTALASLRPGKILSNTAINAMASLSPLLAFLPSRCMVFSTVSMSAKANSVLITSMSDSGSILFDTWITLLSSKQRTTWAMASVSRMLAKNLLPKPSPLEAPATRPAMSTISTMAGWVFCGLTMSTKACMRVSGTSTMPTLGSMVQKG